MILPVARINLSKPKDKKKTKTKTKQTNQEGSEKQEIINSIVGVSSQSKPTLCVGA
jgi:hypothetical protein